MIDRQANDRADDGDQNAVDVEPGDAVEAQQMRDQTADDSANDSRMMSPNALRLSY